MISSARELGAVLGDSGTSITWKIEFHPEEGHNSIAHRTVLDGLEWLFADLRVDADDVLAWQGDSRVALLVAHYENLSEKYGYEISPPRRLVNQVGYELLEVGDTNEAISVFEANVNWYRSSPNVHNSFGDALLRAGRKEDALARNASNPPHQRHPQLVRGVEAAGADGLLTLIAPADST